MNAYSWFSKLNTLNFSKKSVLIIGGGYITNEYLKALNKLKINNIVIVSKTGKNIRDYCVTNKIKLLTGGYKKHLAKLPSFDLVIIACPLVLTMNVLDDVLKYNHGNVLVEKPGSLFHSELSSMDGKTTSKIRIAYNRLTYPSLHKLKTLVKKDGGITSCRFTFTEWVHTIDFKKDPQIVYDLFGIANSLHVISMAFNLIGMPKKINAIQQGHLKWHKSGKIFVGSGISLQNIPFSYHADWDSSGRWSIEIMTKNNAYRLMPLEGLEICPKGKTTWESIKIDTCFKDVKTGITEEIAVMFSNSKQLDSILPTLEEASKFNKIAEKIFGYGKIIKKVKHN